jgi:ubiquinone/menaquinone biosynthesis C-methylase UbiE
MTMALYTVPRMIFANILSKYTKYVPAQGLVLDIGCGLGDLGIFVSEELRLSTVGIDVDVETSILTSDRTKALSNFQLVLYNGKSFPFKNESFDLAYAHEVIEHVDDDVLFLLEVWRILKKDGLFVVSTPNASKEPLNVTLHTDHVRHYTKPQLVAKLRNANISPIAVYWRYHFLGARIDKILYRLGSELIRTRQIQPTMSYWSHEHQPKLTKFVVQIYKYLVKPLISVIVIAEFEIKKARVEAASMVVVCKKQGDLPLI